MNCTGQLVYYIQRTFLVSYLLGLRWGEFEIELDYIDNNSFFCGTQIFVVISIHNYSILFTLGKAFDATR